MTCMSCRNDWLGRMGKLFKLNTIHPATDFTNPGYLSQIFTLAK